MYTPLPRHQVFADLVRTQLDAGLVYTAYVRCTTGDECRVWNRMLEQEIDHSRYLQEQLGDHPDQTIALPEVRIEAFLECRDRALAYYELSAVERVELALRLEHAEIDYGLEGLLLGHRTHSPLPHYHHGVKVHYQTLLEHASRYMGAREVAVQAERLYEHFPELRG